MFLTLCFLLIAQQTKYPLFQLLYKRKAVLLINIKHNAKNLDASINKNRFNVVLESATILRKYNYFHNILRVLDVCQIFVSSQVKQSAIVSNKHGIYKLPNELSNDLRLRILGN